MLCILTDTNIFWPVASVLVYLKVRLELVNAVYVLFVCVRAARVNIAFIFCISIESLHKA
jgi:hypothetical protein